jgi:hypothetical protein
MMLSFQSSSSEVSAAIQTRYEYFAVIKSIKLFNISTLVLRQENNVQQV